MADLSLDDYIQKKNFRVQIQNDTRWKGNNLGLTTKKNQNSQGGAQFDQNFGPSVTVTGLGNVRQFDARQKLGPKVQFDAREHLQKKKPVDARLKISGKRGQSGGLNRNGAQGVMRQRITGPGSGMQGVRQRITGPGTVTLNVRQRITGPGDVQQGMRQRITGPGSVTSGVRQKITGPNANTTGVRQRITGPGSSPQMVRTRITGPGNTSGVQQKIIAPANQSGPTLTVKLGSLGNDARKKIIALQTQKGTFDARSRLGGKSATPEQQITVTGFGNDSQDTGGNINNVNIKQPGESAKGTKIQLTDGGLKVTRAIPSATVSFEGSMLTVTRRTQEYKQQEEEIVPTEMENDQYLQDNELDYCDDENQLDLESAEEIKPKLLQIKKTIKTTPVAVPNPPKIVSATLKRKAPLATPVQSSGPLKLIKPSGGPHIPVIVPAKKAKMTSSLSKPAPKQAKLFQVKESVEHVEEVGEEEESGQDVMSPLQGYRVYVTNLHPVVNQDDIIELFGAIGALRKAKLIKQGVAEVVYVKKDDALKAVQKYHNRELDGLPMQVKLLTSATATIKVPVPPTPDEDNADVPKEGPLKLLKQPAATILRTQADADSQVELPLVHKALFKLGGQGSSKPVTFTVKI